MEKRTKNPEMLMLKRFLFTILTFLKMHLHVKGRSAGKQERSQRTVERFDFLVFFGLLFGSPEIESRIHLRMILGELSLVVIHQY